MMTHEDATKILIQALRSARSAQFGSFGYELYLPRLMRSYVQQITPNPGPFEIDQKVPEISPMFYSAAWELCRRGILRPGIMSMDAQATADGASGNGYCVTPFGREWLAEGHLDDFVPTEPQRFGQLLKPYRERLGVGFYQRAQEAVRCYSAHAYLACCAMCGAATESALLALAIKKEQEDEVLRLYGSRDGTRNVEKIVLKGTPERVANEFRGFEALLKYWRNEAAHGQASDISDNEAFTSLAYVLRFAQFITDNWQTLTT
jgi:hypothetical protein